MKIVRFFLISLITGFIISVYLIYSAKGSWMSVNYLPLFVIAIVAIFALVWLIDWQSHRIQKLLPRPDKNILHFTTRFISGFLSIYLLCGGPILWWFSTIDNHSAFLSGHLDTAARMAFICVLAMLIYLIADFAYYSFKQYHQTVVQNIECQAEQLNLQFEILKNQLSPHFLFNNLNTIYSLIHTDTAKAEMYIRELTVIYQYILKTHMQKTIALSEELKCIKSYQYLTGIRFDNTICLSMEVAPEFLQWNVPPLCIQILVENAIKHNSFDQENPLHINITAQNGRLIVKNNQKAKAEKAESFHIGLQNLQKRYAMLTANKIEIKKDENFMVSLPLISPKKVVDKEMGVRAENN